jgi:hypothetical protein
MRPYTCDNCGHRNYVTRDNLDGERAALGDEAAKRLKMKEWADQTFRMFSTPPPSENAARMQDFICWASFLCGGLFCVALILHFFEII